MTVRTSAGDVVAEVAVERADVGHDALGLAPTRVGTEVDIARRIQR